jgi:hypothetical protein
MHLFSFESFVHIHADTPYETFPYSSPPATKHIHAFVWLALELFIDCANALILASKTYSTTYVLYFLAKKG